MTELNHFIDLDKIKPAVLRHLLDEARKLKRDAKSSHFEKKLVNKQLAMIFEKPSTRTRVSFEVAMQQLGGHALYLSAADCQLGRGETIADTARVLSRYVDAVMLRTFKHSALKEMAEQAAVPVINGLTNYSHPCQIMADIMTFEEHRGNIKGKTVAWLGDANNVANSWIQAAKQFGFTFRLACPEELVPPEGSLPEHVKLLHDPMEAAKEADLVVTDTWVSMGEDSDAEKKKQTLAPFQVTDGIMRNANKDALFMHCLPAHRGQEVAPSVIDGPQSVVWDEAENRLHIQKAILLWCLE